ncbi:MAG: proline--tRNA ligase [Alphaproteobacteria bacterium]|nr:proline--tRNA ligase [Alphaproteobacteria bacterium]
MSNAPAAKASNYKSAIQPTRAENFPEWYQAVVKEADLAESSAVRGCYVIKPYGYGMWENIQRELDARIKECDVQNAYFPLLIPVEYLSKEAEHVDGFAKECAVVTHHRLEKGPDGKLIPASPLEHPYVIRPTSETIIGETIKNWIQSYRDLPCKLNQWCNVMRWEMRPRVFLRTAEFLWQEGHNCLETADGSREDALLMLSVYKDLMENCLALPVMEGEKTADERFPGAIATYTLELMMQDGKALQGCTSHDLGQTFSKSCDIKFQGRDGKEQHAWTTSWGLTTRTIGAILMAHGDDDGAIMPPVVATYQVAIIPFLKDDAGKDALLGYCNKVKTALKAKGIRVSLDASDVRASNKTWDAIKKGIPLRVEIGEKEMAEGNVTHIRRDLGKDSKQTVSVDEFVNNAERLLQDIHKSMFEKAKAFRDSHIFDVKTVDEVRDFFKADKAGFVRADVSILEDKALEAVRKEFAITPRCIPFSDSGKKVLLGKSY